MFRLTPDEPGAKQRRPPTIVYADVAGHSRLIGGRRITVSEPHR